MEREIDRALHEFDTDRLDVVTLYYIESQREWDGLIAPGGALTALEAAKQTGAVRNGPLPALRTLPENWASFGGSLADLNLAYGTAYYAVLFLAGRIGGMPLMQILSDVDAGLTFEQSLNARAGFNLETMDGAFKEWMWATVASPQPPQRVPALSSIDSPPRTYPQSSSTSRRSTASATPTQ